MKKELTVILITIVIIAGCTPKQESPEAMLHFTGSPNEKNIRPVELVSADNSYHLFYRYENPHDSSFIGHSTSTNLYHWKYPRQTLPFSPEKNAVTFFSSDTFSSTGSEQIIAAAINHNDLQNITFYSHSANTKKWRQHSFSGELSTIPATAKDIKIFYHPLEGWHLALLTGTEIWFYQTKDQKTWQHTGTTKQEDIGQENTFSDIDIVAMTLENEPLQMWVLLLTASKGSPNQSAGTKYIAGDFSEGVFLPSCNDFGWIDYGSDQQCAVAVTSRQKGGELSLSLGALARHNVKSESLSLPRKISLYEEYNRIFLRSGMWHKTAMDYEKQQQFAENKYSGFNPLSNSFSLPMEISIAFDTHNRKYLDYATAFGISFKNDKKVYRAGYHTDKRYFFIKEGTTDEEGNFRVTRANYAPIIFTGSELEMQLYIHPNGTELFALNGKVSLSHQSKMHSSITNAGVFTEEGSITINKAEFNKIKGIQQATANQTQKKEYYEKN
jgi:sucrose-6-phosphate hydrolase SacC (GH32 family)